MVETIVGQPFDPQQGAPYDPRDPAQAPLSNQRREGSNVRLDNDRDLSRVGGWFLGLSAIGVLIGGAFMLAGGILPGALVVAASALCGMIGLLAWGLVAHHQG